MVRHLGGVTYPVGVKFLRRSNADQQDQTSAPSEQQDDGAGNGTQSKGRPTPKRREAEAHKRGPVPPPPQTQREAAKRARERKASKQTRREDAAYRRERMMAGDDNYLMPRDKGPVRAHARDVVDSRRHIMGLFMPLVLVVFATTLVQQPAVQQYGTLGCMVLLIIMIVEGSVLGVVVNRRVRAKFPNTQEGGLGLGWYAFTRAMQIRKLRAPRPRVTPKDAASIG